VTCVISIPHWIKASIRKGERLFAPAKRLGLS
jgi:hypothetical protein